MSLKISHSAAKSGCRNGDSYKKRCMDNNVNGAKKSQQRYAGFIGFQV